MFKFSKWLRDNGFTITSEYSNIINSMRFEKGNLKFTIEPTYSGNKVSWHNLYVKKNEYISYRYDKDGKLICGEGLQRDLILKLEEYMNKEEN